jgi:hypothetical protein
MPDRRRHRGPHPEDPALFAPSVLPALRAAASELSWLYERGYKPVSSLKLVGDRHGLTERQRAAVSRCACADGAALLRRSRALEPAAISGEPLCIDTFNVLTTLEVALSGGVVLIGRDACLRDIAGVHGSYRRVAETEPALQLLARTLCELGVADCVWLLDAPVSNSGRLATSMRAHASAHALAWQVELVPDPDPLLARSSRVVASADGAVLDLAARSFNLARVCVERCVPDAWVLDLSSD